MLEVRLVPLFKNKFLRIALTLLNFRIITFTLLLLCVLSIESLTSHALTLTPHELNVTMYGEEQEHIITIINDEFKPHIIEFVPTSDSLYLQAYVDVRDNNFILNPRDQKNVRIVTNFPKDFPPQEHRFILHPELESEESVVIAFRPPGISKPELQLRDVQEEVEGSILLVTLEVKNTGNVYVHITPKLILTNQEDLFEETEYPQHLLVAPGENYTLTLRKEIIQEGNYSANISILYFVDDIEESTNTKKINFLIKKEKNKEEIKKKEFPLLFIVIGVAALTMIILWAGGRKKSPSEIRMMRAETKKLHKEVHKMAKETKKLIEKQQR